MNLFQWITVPILLALLVVEVIGVLRRRKLGAVPALRCLVWAGAAIAIARPDLPQFMASTLGITRGADLVLYFLCLTFLAVSFYFYARYVRLQRQVTEVIRHLAIQEAQRGRGGAA